MMPLVNIQETFLAAGIVFIAGILHRNVHYCCWLQCNRGTRATLVSGRAPCPDQFREWVVNFIHCRHHPLKCRLQCSYRYCWCPALLFVREIKNCIQQEMSRTRLSWSLMFCLLRVWMFTEYRHQHIMFFDVSMSFQLTSTVHIPS